METTFYQDAGATVTNARFMINGQTHALSGITSVSRQVQYPNRLRPLICLLLGMLVLGFQYYWMGLLLIVVAGLWLYIQKALYSVVIHTAAGQRKALTDQSEDRVGKIIAALNEAIVHRG